ncbi:MAG: HAD family hydrolase [Capsulimonas sp.]|uniref:HAD family hydrolase n=1 Tax=Capsulimonas sp. TaxID=2494211 RepID=UPI003264435B
MNRKLLVLDLDETLVYAARRPLERAAGFAVGPYFVYKRPGVDDFLAFCFAHFETAVWTSATRDYAEAIVQILFPQPPSFLWAIERCTVRYDPDCDAHVGTKNLVKLKRRGYRLEQVIVVDDSPEKHLRSYGNLVRVAPWTGDTADDDLLRLPRYLRTLANVENVRTVEKRRWRSESEQ